MGMVSPAQQRVLVWLKLFPGVRLNLYPSGWVQWSHAWADSDAYQSMLAVSRVLGMDAKCAPAGTIVRRGTPRCTLGTFNALRRMNLVACVGGRARTNIYTARWDFQLSGRGRIELASLATD